MVALVEVERRWWCLQEDVLVLEEVVVALEETVVFRGGAG